MITVSFFLLTFTILPFKSSSTAITTSYHFSFPLSLIMSWEVYHIQLGLSCATSYKVVLKFGLTSYLPADCQSHATCLSMAWRLHTPSHNTWWTWKTKQDNRTDHQIKRYWRILCNHQTLFLWKEVINEWRLRPICFEDIQEFLGRGYLNSPNVVPQLDSQMLNIPLNLAYLEVFLKKIVGVGNYSCWFQIMSN